MKQSEHKKHLPQNSRPIKIALLITSDSRTEKTDKTGRLMIDYLGKAGHHCITHKIIRNNITSIRASIKKIIQSDAQVIITSGGTGCGEKDVTIEAVTPLIAKEMNGFGELFRFLSYKEIGSSAIMSRALLGITKNKKIICVLPGSPRAMFLALKKLLIPELQHILWELTRRPEGRASPRAGCKE
ncbi:MAG: molybdenum cofactor biosynthesis protein B [Planctomycetota bacterium]